MIAASAAPHLRAATGPRAAADLRAASTTRRGVLRLGGAGMAASGLTALGVGGAIAVPSAEPSAEPSAGPSTASARPRRGPVIAILLYDGFTALDVVGPHEVFARIPGAQLRFVAERTGPVPTDTRLLTLPATHSLDEVTSADVLFVPGGGAGSTAAAMNPRLQRWVAALHRTTTWTTSVCTGAFLLGTAGLLRGRPATTYWTAVDQLSTVGALPRRERVVRSGKIITGAGVSAGLDMALVLAEYLTDRRTATALQLALEYDPQPPYDAGDAATASTDQRELAQRLVAAADRYPG
ncbi:MAG: DJ-1/PfpI family protein [Dermatophilaceae bacterium]